MQITRLLTEGLNHETWLQNKWPELKTRIEQYNDSLRQALAEGHSYADVAAHVMLELKETMQHSVNWDKIQCRKGCGFCCHVNVEISEGEAQLIINYCKKKGIQIEQEVLKAQLNLSTNERPFHRFADCVFLDKDNACKIYEARPLNCRKHLVHTDPDLCDNTKHENSQVGINFDINAEILVSAYYSLNMKQGTMAEMMLAKMD